MQQQDCWGLGSCSSITLQRRARDSRRSRRSGAGRRLAMRCVRCVGSSRGWGGALRSSAHARALAGRQAAACSRARDAALPSAAVLAGWLEGRGATHTQPPASCMATSLPPPSAPPRCDADALTAGNQYSRCALASPSSIMASPSRSSSASTLSQRSMVQLALVARSAGSCVCVLRQGGGSVSGGRGHSCRVTQPTPQHAQTAAAATHPC